MEKPGNQINRPELLTLLCILTFIGSGLAAFSNLFILLTFDEVNSMMEQYEFNIEEFKLILAGGRKFFAAGFVLYFISLMGATLMWKLKKAGFHMYTASQVFLLLLPVVTIREMQFSVWGLLLTAAFVGAYYSQTKYMK